MVFATVGTQAPFDRFLKIIDEAAALLDEEIIVQAFKDKYEPKYVKVVDFLPPDEFNQLFAQARMIVAHAGMGTIISAMQLDKPIVVFPRIAALGEHRNEHQTATAKQMDKMHYAYVAYNESQLKEFILKKDMQPLHHLGDHASPELVQSLIDFIG
jgi:UDP-N-acetylglucosamine transferase subunit ALG13